MDKQPPVSASFFGLGIAPKILEILDRMKFKVPTPIQLKALPIAIEGKDIIGIAQTGTGKTLAFGIPMIQRLVQTQGKGLVLVPTRELAIQVNEAVRKLAQQFAMRTTVLVGGGSMYMQTQDLRRGSRLLICTPGRLLDHISQRNVRLSDIKMLVLDEADRMLDMGFAPQIEKILAQIPKDRQTMLFSATMPEKIVKMAVNHMKLPVSVEIARSGTAAEHVKQELFIIRHEEKYRLLIKMLERYLGPVLLFCRTKRGAKRITLDIRHSGFSAAEIHSNRSLQQRREALEGFKSGKYKVLVATDIASRGIDVKGIELVINYDLPDDAEDYIHRIGRTGRAGHKGIAVSFATPEQGGDVKKIERLMRSQLPVVKHPDIPTAEFTSFAPTSRRGPVRRSFHSHRKRRFGR